MQLVSSKIWTRVAVSISYNDNHYTTGTFGFCYEQAAAFKWAVTKLTYTLFKLWILSNLFLTVIVY